MHGRGRPWETQDELTLLEGNEILNHYFRREDANAPPTKDSFPQTSFKSRYESTSSKSRPPPAYSTTVYNASSLPMQPNASNSLTNRHGRLDGLTAHQREWESKEDLQLNFQRLTALNNHQDLPQPQRRSHYNAASDRYPNENLNSRNSNQFKRPYNHKREASSRTAMPPHISGRLKRKSSQELPGRVSKSGRHGEKPSSNGVPSVARAHKTAQQSMTQKHTRVFSGPPNSQQEQDVAFRTGIQPRTGTDREGNNPRTRGDVIVIDDLLEHQPHSAILHYVGTSRRPTPGEANNSTSRHLVFTDQPGMENRVAGGLTSSLLQNRDYNQEDVKHIPAIRSMPKNSRFRSRGRANHDPIVLDEDGEGYLQKSSKHQQDTRSQQNINFKQSQPRASSRHNLTAVKALDPKLSASAGGFSQVTGYGRSHNSSKPARQTLETFEQSRLKLPSGQKHRIDDYIILDDDTDSGDESFRFAKTGPRHHTNALGNTPAPDRGGSHFQKPATISHEKTNSSERQAQMSTALAHQQSNEQSDDDSGDENNIGIALQANSGRKNAARHVLNDKESKKTYSDRMPIRTINKPDVVESCTNKGSIFIQDNEPVIQNVKINTEKPRSLYAQSVQQLDRPTKKTMEEFLRKMKAKQFGATHQRQELIEADYELPSFYPLESDQRQATTSPLVYMQHSKMGREERANCESHRNSSATDPENVIISFPKPQTGSNTAHPDTDDRERYRLFQARKAEVAARKREDRANPNNKTIERAKKLAEQDAQDKAREDEMARQQIDQQAKETKEQKIRHRRERKAQSKAEANARKATQTPPASDIFGMESRAPPSLTCTIAAPVTAPVTASIERAPETTISIVLPTGLGVGASGESAKSVNEQDIIMRDDAGDLLYGSDEEVRKELAELEALELKVAADKERERELKAEQDANEAKAAEKGKSLAIIREKKLALFKGSDIVKPAEPEKSMTQSPASTDQARYLSDLRDEIDAMSRESEAKPVDQLTLELRIDEKQQTQVNSHIARLTALAGPKFEENERQRARHLNDIHNRIAILKAQGQGQAVNITSLSTERSHNQSFEDGFEIREQLDANHIDPSISANQKSTEDVKFRVNREKILSADPLEPSHNPADGSEQDIQKANFKIPDGSSHTEQQLYNPPLTGSYLQDREEARKKMHFLTVDEAAKLTSRSQLAGSKKRTPTFLDQVRKQGRDDASRLKRDQNLLAIGSSEQRYARSDRLHSTPSTPAASLTGRKPKPKTSKDKPVPIDKITEDDLLLITLRQEGLQWKDVWQHWVRRTGKTTRQDGLRKRFRCLMKTLNPTAYSPRGRTSEERNLKQEILQVKQEQARRNVEGSPLFIGEDETAPKFAQGLVGLSNADILARARDILTADERAALDPARPTHGGKCINSAAMKRYFAENRGDHDSDDTEDDSDDERDVREPSPFTEEDKCHFAYYVKRKVVRSDQGENEDEVDWLMVGPMYTSLKDANAAAGAELGVMRGGVDARSICGQSWERGEDGMIRWSAKLEDGFVIVEVDKHLRTFQDGIVPESKWGWVSKRAFVARMRTMEYSDGAEEIGGANEANTQAEMEAAGDEIVDVREIDGNEALGAGNQGSLDKEGELGVPDEDVRGDIQVGAFEGENQRFGVWKENISTKSHAPLGEADMAPNRVSAADDPFDYLFDDKIEESAFENGAERISKTIKQSEHNRNPKALGAQLKVLTTRLLNVEDIGSIYTYRDQANRAAAKRFMEAKRAMTPSSQRRKIDHVLAEQAAEKEMQERLDELEMLDESFTEQFEMDGRVVEVHVVERLLEGPRNI